MSSFRTAVWDPKLIVGQIACNQCVFYSAECILMFTWSLFSDYRPSLDHVFTPIVSFLVGKLKNLTCFLDCSSNFYHSINLSRSSGSCLFKNHSASQEMSRFCLYNALLAPDSSRRLQCSDSVTTHLVASSTGQRNDMHRCWRVLLHAKRVRRNPTDWRINTECRIRKLITNIN